MSESERRPLHPGAWWAWALLLAVAASRTTNPLLLVLIVAVAGFVVAARRTEAPWARSYRVFLVLGLTVLGLRLVVQLVFGTSYGGTVLLHLPSVPLPHWAAGVRLGGDVTAPALATAAYEGVQLATLLALVGAANALANPLRLLRAAPAGLYEAGVALTVALTLAPQAVAQVSRVRAAHRLRGRPHRGLRGLRAMALPVLEGALERSVGLAASMDSRGYGRRGERSPLHRTLAGLAVVLGLVAAGAGTYALLASSGPRWLAVGLVGIGMTAAVGASVLSAPEHGRTRYRPDPWRSREWGVVVCGAVAAVAVLASTAGLTPVIAPSPQWPALPWLPVLGALVATLPAVLG